MNIRFLTFLLFLIATIAPAANEPISSLPIVTTAANGDQIVIYQGTPGAFAQKRIDFSHFQSSISTLAWSAITGTPTTAAGYGITHGAAIDTLGAKSSNGTGNIILSAGTLAISTGQTLTVTTGGTLNSAAYVASSTFEPALGNPGVNGYVLSSTTGGVRSWIAGSTFDPTNPGPFGATPSTVKATTLNLGPVGIFWNSGSFRLDFGDGSGGFSYGVRFGSIASYADAVTRLMLLRGIQGYGVEHASGEPLSWSSNPSDAAGGDTFIGRVSTGNFYIKGGNPAGSSAAGLAIYNTFTDASNYSKTSIGLSGSTMAFSTVEAGTGVGTQTGYSFDKTIFVGTGGTRLTTQDLYVSRHIFGSSAGTISWGSGRVDMWSPGLGILLLQDGNTDSTFDRIQFGGTTASFPAWKRVGTTFAARLADDSADADASFANIISATAGKGLQLQSGANQRAGNVTLVGGTVAVANTTITANSAIELTRKTPGGVVGDLSYSLNAGVGFTINSANPADTSTVTYFIIEVNP